MAESKRGSRVGQKVGKDPRKTINVTLTGSKYSAGGSKNRKKKGGIIRKPKPPIRYRKGRSS
jgi:hypothetical protein